MTLDAVLDIAVYCPPMGGGAVRRRLLMLGVQEFANCIRLVLRLIYFASGS
jgi:hypothetical protein